MPIGGLIKKVFGTSHEREIKRLRPRVERINDLEPAMQKLTDAELRGKTAEFKQKLDNGATLDDILVGAFAVCREAGRRVLEHAPLRRAAHRRHGAAQGRIAEMRTGEGKTLVATLPAVPERARRARACTSSPSTTTSPRATPSGWAALQVPRHDRRHDRPRAERSREAATRTAATSPTARTTSSASTTCATT